MLSKEMINTMARTGRPNFYTAERLQKKVDEYFRDTKEADKMPSVVDLALYLGFYSERALMRYTEESSVPLSDKEDLVRIITRAKEMIKSANVQALYNRETTRGAQFVLQNGFGYSEKQEIRHDAVINVKITDE